MHDVLRQRLLRKIESLPDDQIYQVLDYIEFLESKYVTAEGVSSSGLQRFAEGLEDKLRRRAVSPSTIREAFQLISAADRVLSGVSSAGRQILDDLGQALEVDDGDQASPATDDPDAQRIEADPRKRRSTRTRSSAASTRSSSPGGASASGRGASGAPDEASDGGPDGSSPGGAGTDSEPDRGGESGASSP